MDQETLAKFEKIEKRLSLLEQGAGLNGETTLEKSVVEMDLILPEAEISGLHFNQTEVHAVFEKQADGWWHSRGILFLSARNTEDDNSRDILTEYLTRYNDAKGNVKDTLIGQISIHFGVAAIDVEISLPTENEGIKQYNGVDWWYWQKEPYSGSAASFCYVHSNGLASCDFASAVGGCAPAFRVAG